MTRNETVAGRMARTMPELDRRELACLMAENQHRELAASAPGQVSVGWVMGWQDAAMRAVRDRAQDAQVVWFAKTRCRDLHDGHAYSDCAGYWAALP